ncbi:MAG: zinc-binding dehydrogenase [Limimaricola sp.]|nr:zinc-binding dehydrogenase [Limimaricola sp.]
MQAMVLTGHGDMGRLVWRTDVPRPDPGPGEVLIRVGACGLNATDVNTRIGWYSRAATAGVDAAAGSAGLADIAMETGTWTGKPIPFPLIQGADTVGRIVAVGAGVDAARVGERVLVDPWLLGAGDWLNPANAPYYGTDCDGGFAQYSVIRAANAHAIETDLPDAELATLPCGLTTADNLVGKTAPRPGETVVVAGASGGVGTLAVQLAHASGARVIGLAAPAKADRLRALGCDAVVDSRAPDLAERIRAAAGGPVEAAIDVIGGAVFAGLIGALRQGGRYAASGALGGPVVQFDLRDLIYKDLRLMGATIVPPGNMARLVRMVERGQVRPQLAATYPLRELHAAQRAFLDKAHVGSIVVVP